MRTGNLRQLAARPGMPSEPTIRKLIASRADFPILRQAGLGVSHGYLFDLDAAEAFILAQWTDGRRAPACRHRGPSAFSERKHMIRDQLTGSVWEHDYRPDLKLVMLALAALADDKHEVEKMSYAYLSSITGFSRGQVIHALQILETDGHIAPVNSSRWHYVLRPGPPSRFRSFLERATAFAVDA